MNLRARQLSKAFGSQWAVRDIDFEVRSGERVALLGENGAGKTTLLKLLSTLLQPTTGSVEIDNLSLARDGARLRARVGYFVPSAHFYESLTASENLRLFLSLYGKSPSAARVDQVLERVDLAAQRDRFVSALSTGMKCRLMIAKWLLVEPDFLFFDEPYGPLDGAGVDLLESFVSDLTQADRTVIVATHQIPRALGLCSRALILRQGRLVFDGASGEATAVLSRSGQNLLPRGERWSS